MNNSIVFLEFTTCIWLARCAWFAMRTLARTRRTIDIVVVAHFLFCGIPLACDLLLGRPAYLSFPGFAEATSHAPTRILYCLYVAACPPVWWILAGVPVAKRPVFPSSRARATSLTKRYRYWLITVMVMPAVMLCLAPDLEFYREYSMQARDLRSQPIEVISFHPYLCIACMLGVVAAAGVVMGFRGVGRSCVFVLPCLVACAWLVGKRYIVGLEIILMGYALWYRGMFRSRRRVLAGGGAAVACLLAFSTFYQSAARKISLASLAWDAVYDNMRIDYGRDDVIKTTIYSELHPDRMQILDYRGQSLLIYATLPIPRSLWRDKPISYGTSMACEALQQPKEYLGWCMTTSILEETIANFGWLGLFVGPLIVSLVCHLGDRCRDGLIGAFTAIVAVFLLAVHLSAFAPILLVWAGLIVWHEFSSARVGFAQSGSVRVPLAATPTPVSR